MNLMYNNKYHGLKSQIIWKNISKTEQVTPSLLNHTNIPTNTNLSQKLFLYAL